jgi:histidine triad (HIT) family protein
MVICLKAAALTPEERGMKDCEFCQILRGEIRRYVVFEDQISLGFLDDRPLFPGHVLLIPRRHYPTLADLPPGLIRPLFFNVRLLSRAVEEGMAAQGSFVAINNRISQSVPHLHVHVVPRRPKDGLRGFFWPRNPYRDEAHFQEVQEALKGALQRLSREAW